MLGQMRNQTGSLIIWVLFAIIIAAFVLFFGSPSDSLGCGSTKSYSIEVDGEPVSVNSWRFAYNGIPYLQRIPGDERKPLALEFLLQREILAQAAESMDLRVSDSVIDEAVAAGEFYLLGNKMDGTKIYFENSEDEGFFFNYDYLKNLAQGRLGLPDVQSYKNEQRREIMAYRMKQEVLSASYVSVEEARDVFVRGNTSVSLKYVKFDTQRYRAGVKLSEEQVTAYAKDHEDALQSAWEQVKPRWESDKTRVRARIIRIAKSEPNTSAPLPAKNQAPSKGEKDSASPTDPGRAVIDRAREKLLGGARFADVAAEVSTDRTASLGGLIGWRAATSLGYGQELVDASKDLEIGKVSEVVDAGRSYFLIIIEDRSDKGLNFEQKKFDLAVKAAPADLADALAKSAAEAALVSAQNAPLEDLFPEAAPSGGIDFKNLDPEILKQLSPEQLKQLIESSAGKGKTGAIVVEGPTQYAQLGGEAAAESGAAEAEATMTSSAALSRVAAASGVTPPNTQELQGTTRNADFIAGIGRSKKLVTDLFEVLGVGDLGGKVYKVRDSDGYVIVRLTDRSEADMKKFKEDRARLQAALGEAKGAEHLQEWLVSRCLSLKKAGAISVNPAMLRGSNDKQLAYEPCSLMSQGR